MLVRMASSNSSNSGILSLSLPTSNRDITCNHPIGQGAHYCKSRNIIVWLDTRTHCNSLRLTLNQGNNTNITVNAKNHLDMS